MLALFPGRERAHEVPDAWPETLAILSAYPRLGKDAEGNSTLAELRQWLAENNIADQGERDAWADWFRAVDAEVQRFRAEKIEETTRDRG
jgi:hypothetical protein